MRKIIAGLAYDTDTAEEVYFHFYRETLYKTAGARWFIHGVGYASSPYNEPAGSSSYTGGEAIRPLSVDEAREWLESHAPAETFERHFTVQED